MMGLKNRPLNSESFSSFFNNIPNPAFAWQIVGEELVLIDFNDATEKLSFEGVSLGVKASELFKDNERILTNLVNCLSEKSNFSEEYEYQMKKTGEHKNLSTSFIFLPPDLVILHIEDLTMQKQVSKALQKARDVLTGLELILNQSPAVVFLLRNEEGWPVEYITDNIRQFGYDASDFYSHILNYADIIHPDDIENIVRGVYLKCQNSATEFVQEYRIVSKLGEHRWINVRTWIKRNRENNITHFQGIILDITERRETEEKLKESDEKFRKITEQSLLGVAILQKGKVKYVNKALAEIAEFEPNEVKKWPMNEFVKSIYPDDLPMVMEKMQIKLEENKELITRYIFRILTKSRKIKWLEIISKTVSYQGDLALLATIIDVTEKKEAEIKLKESEENLKKLNEALEQKVSERTRDLKESEEKYRFLYNHTPIGIGTATKNGKLIAMNKILEEMLGYVIEEINEMDITFLYANPHRRELLLSTLKNKGRLREFEVSLKRKDGSEFLALMNTDIIDLKGEKIIHTTVRDITKQKIAEQKLRESEKKYREILENMMEGYFENDLKGTLTFVNDFYCKLVGNSKEEIIGTNYRSIFDENRSREVYRKYNQLYNNEIPSPLIYENNMLTKSGETLYYEVLVDLKYDSEGNKVGFFGIFRDITERKKADQKLKESEEKWRSMTENSPDFIITLDKDERIVYINRSEILNLKVEELIGQTVYNFIPDDYHEAAKECIKRVFMSGQNDRYYSDFIYDDGTIHYFESRVGPILNEGNVVGFTISSTDITKRKKAEKKLHLSNEIMKNMVEGVYLIRFDDGIIAYANPKFEDMFGYDFGEMVGKHVSIVNAPTDKKPEEIAIEIMDTLEEAGEWHGEVKNIKKDGTLFWCYANVSTFDHSDYGKVLVSIHTDITEKKLIGEKLKESEEKFRTIADQSLMGICIVQDDIIKYVNQRMADINGYSLKEIMSWQPKEFYKTISAESLDLVSEQANKQQSGHPDVIPQYTLQIIKKSGEKIWIENFSKSINFNGRPAALVTFFDISDKKKVEQKLKESEEKYRGFVNNISDIIYELDISGNCLYVSLQLFDISGFTPEEMIGENVFKYVHPDDLTKIAEEVKKAFKYGGSSYIEFRLRHKDGHYLPISSRFNVITIGGKQKLTGVLMDMTERKEVEIKLKESELNYKEAYKKAEFYKDIFTHDINNIISNIKSAIEFSAIYLKDPERVGDIEKLYEVIRGQFTKGASLVSNIRKLSQIEESVSLVKPVEINGILKKEIDFMLNSYQTRELTIRTHGFEKEALVDANDLLIDLFNNLFNNSIKYNDSHVVEIEVKMSREKKNNTNFIKLEFLDNGIGILDKQKDKLFEREYVKDISSKGLGIGLTLVKKIVESYKGEIWVEDRIEGDYTQGSNFIVLIPEVV